jgi:hypothetical protein
MGGRVIGSLPDVRKLPGIQQNPYKIPHFEKYVRREGRGFFAEK